ncbi:MAG: ATPase, T2SS/T4P/T4SS family [Anaerorhabdus sp.]
MSDQKLNHIDFGLLKEVLRFQDVTDVSCKNDGEVWVTSNERGHFLYDVIVSEKEVIRIANQIANKMQKEFNPANPSLEGDIQEEEVDYRVGCVHRYLSPQGTTLVIRKVRKKLFLSYHQLIEESISREALNLLIWMVKAKMNMIFIGETGSGKTELLKFLAQYIPKNEVVVTIEDSLEFNLKSLVPDLSCTSFRVRKDVTYQSIVSMTLRLNVERILLQEARGVEVDDLLDAMSTGHTVMTTMHAKSSEMVATRVSQMLKNKIESYDSIKKRVFGLVDVVVLMEKIKKEEKIYRVVKEISFFEYDSNTDLCLLKKIYQNGDKITTFPKVLKESLVKGRRK